MVDLRDAQKTTTIAFTGDGSYSLPSDFKSAEMVYDRVNNIHYKQVSPIGRILSEDAGEYTYSLVGSAIEIESASSSATITLVYYSTHDAKTSLGVTQKGLSASTDEPLLSNRFHDYFVEDTSSVLFRKQRKYDDYGVAKSEAKRLLEAIERDNITHEETVVEVFSPYSESYE